MYHAFIGKNERSKMVCFLDFFIFPEPLTGKLHVIGQHFYTMPEYRSSGISAKVYREAIRFAKRQGAEIAELFCFSDEQERWTKKGYKPARTLVRRKI